MARASSLYALRTLAPTRVIASFALSTALFGCGGAATSEPKVGESEPAPASPDTPTAGKKLLDVEAMLSREAEGLTKRNVEFKGLRAEVLSKSAPKVKPQTGAIAVEIPIGTQAAVNCFALAEDSDPGATFFAVLEQARKVGELKQVRMLPPEVVQENAAVGMMAIYVINQEGGAAVGELKVIHHPRTYHASYCVHDELGYHETFASVARSFFESQDRGVKLVPPSYVDIQTAAVNGQPAGYERFSLMPEKDGKRMQVSMGLMALPRSESDIALLDYASVRTLDAKGVILDGRFIQVENGRTTVDVTLKQKAGKKYEYSGTVQGKEVSGTVTTKGAKGLLSSTVTEAKIAEQLAKGGAFTITQEGYDPSSDPAQTQSIEFKREKSDPAQQVRMKMPDSEVIGLADKNGRMVSGELKLGPLAIELKRAYERGSVK